MKNIKWGLLIIGASIFFTGYFLAKMDSNRKEIERLDKKLFDEQEETEEPDDYTDPFLLRIFPEDVQSDSQNASVRYKERLAA